jgi:hypothetical protein
VGTAAEAQAFKRACSCFGLGRYLYDLEGQWVDLDEKKRPLETARLPDWPRPKSQRTEQRRAAARQNGSAPASTNGNDSGRYGRGGLYRDELSGKITSLARRSGSASRGVCSRPWRTLMMLRRSGIWRSSRWRSESSRTWLGASNGCERQSQDAGRSAVRPCAVN